MKLKYPCGGDLKEIAGTIVQVYECKKCEEVYDMCDHCGGNPLIEDSGGCYFCKMD